MRGELVATDEAAAMEEDENWRSGGVSAARVEVEFLAGMGSVGDVVGRRNGFYGVFVGEQKRGEGFECGREDGGDFLTVRGVECCYGVHFELGSWILTLLLMVDERR